MINRATLPKCVYPPSAVNAFPVTPYLGLQLSVFILLLLIIVTLRFVWSWRGSYMCHI